MKEKNTFKELNKQRQNIHLQADEMYRLSDSFMKTGNAYIAVKLQDMADEIMDSADAIVKVYTDDIDSQVRATNAQLGKLLSAAAKL